MVERQAQCVVAEAVIQLQGQTFQDLRRGGRVEQRAEVVEQFAGQLDLVRLAIGGVQDDAAAHVPTVHPCTGQVIEAELRTVAKRQPAAVIVVEPANIRVDQAFAKQRLDQALETALGGRIQGIAQMIEGNAVGLERLGAEGFAPAREQLLLILRIGAHQALFLEAVVD
ncbi:hypothetical protein D3C84_280310 [compost metagenome]